MGRPPWSRASAPGSLVQYVPRDIGRFLANAARTLLPPPGVADPYERARQVFVSLLAADIRYGREPTSSEPGRQVIREPGEVLAGPRHGTCLDLAVIFAGACLDAALHPVIVVLDAVQGTQPAHAIVLVWTGGDWELGGKAEYPLWEHLGDPGASDFGILRHKPDELVAGVRTARDEPGRFVALDAALLAMHAAGRDGDDPDTLWQAAVARGAGLITGNEWRWSVGIDVGMLYHAGSTLPAPLPPKLPALIAAYHDTDGALDRGPLAALRPRSGMVPFCAREELHLLRDWFDALTNRRGLQIALVHGVGGSGKTRLAAELCHRLESSRDWYTGFVRRGAPTSALEYLSQLTCPVLVVVDYPEGVPEHELIEIVRALAVRDEPTGLLFTARQPGQGTGQWWSRIAARAVEENLRIGDQLLMPLQETHPTPSAVFRAALAALNPPTAPTPDLRLPSAPRIGRWTTLDLVMLAWLRTRQADAEPAGNFPTSRSDLYDRIWSHELGYWDRAYQRLLGQPLRRDAARVAACVVTALEPPPARVMELLSAIPAFHGETKWAGDFADVLSTVLPAEDGSGLTIRPDAIGDHLLVGELQQQPDLLVRILGDPPTNPASPTAGGQTQYRLSEAARSTACRVLTRAAQWHQEAAIESATYLLRMLPDIWNPALLVAIAQGGPFARTMTDLAREAAQADGAAPKGVSWERLAVIIPHDHSTLSELAAIAAQASATPQGESADDLVQAAQSLHNLSVRLAEDGNVEASVQPAEQAVAFYRRLAAHDAMAFTGELGEALNTLSIQLAKTGDVDRALGTAEEAVSLLRSDSHQSQPQVIDHVDLRRFGLSAALGGLALRLQESGRIAAAIGTIREAIQITRDEVPQAEAGMRFSLAALLSGHLNNLGAMLISAGQAEPGVAPLQEAVALRSNLAEALPAVYQPPLAESLHYLGTALRTSHRFAESIQVGQACVDTYRTLAGDNPRRFTEKLVRALHELADAKAAIHHDHEAAAVAQEAVEIARATQGSPDRDSLLLAAALRQLAGPLIGTGQTDRALEALTEAVAIYRAFHSTGPGLAEALLDVSRALAKAGRSEEAVDRAQEAAALHRRLAEGGAQYLTAALADALLNLGEQLLGTGQSGDAQQNIREAMEISRRLAETGPEYALKLADTLGKAAQHFSAMTRWEDALAVAGEAVQLLRSSTDNRILTRGLLASSLHSYADVLREAGRDDEALTARQEGLAVMRALATAEPGHLPVYARQMANLGVDLTAMGRHDDAVAVTAEALRLFRQLASTDPDIYTRDVALCLDQLGIRLASAGRPADALAPTQEAVDINRELIHTEAGDPTRLADSLDHLAQSLYDAGRPNDAVGPFREAIGLYRTTTRPGSENIAVLARTLHNLAAVLPSGSTEATSALREAVELFRPLAMASPAAHGTGLAAALTSLGTRTAQARAGNEAVDLLHEAISLYADMAEDDPLHEADNHLTALINLGHVRAATGEWPTELEQAVSLARRLVDLDADAYVLSLASALMDLGRASFAAGHRAEAIAALQEAVSLYRSLSASQPEPHLGALESALQLFADLFLPDVALATQPWDEARTGLETASSAHVLATEAAWRLDRGIDGWLDLLRRAVLLAAETPGASTWTGSVRRDLRTLIDQLREQGHDDAITDLTPHLPPWSYVKDANQAVAEAQRFLTVKSWEEERTALSAATTLTGPEGRTALELVHELHPELDLGHLRGRLADIERHGLPAVLDDLAQTEHQVNLVLAWVQTSSWPESRQFLADNPELLSSSVARDVLTDLEQDRRQHLNLLRLVSHTSIDQAYAILTDLDVAEQAVSDAIGKADIKALLLIATAVPNLQARPFTFLSLGLAAELMRGPNPGQDPSATATRDFHRVTSRLLDYGSAVQHHTLARQLRELIVRRPDLRTQVIEVIDMLTAPSPPATGES